MTKNLRIHFLSDTLQRNSGFSNVTKNIILELKKRGYECTMTGLNSGYMKTWDYGIECYPIANEHIGEEASYFATLMEIKPDIVFNLFGSDTGDMDFLLDIPLQAGITKRIWYVPVDGLGLGIGSFKSLKRFTDSGGKVVAQCNWGATQLMKNGIDVLDTVYHGYNEKIFKKLTDSELDSADYCWYMINEGKTEINPDFLFENCCWTCCDNHELCVESIEEEVGIMKWDDVEKRFIYGYYLVSLLRKIVKGRYVFGFVGANFGIRKRIERLLKAYQLTIKDDRRLTDRTVLWLHTVPISNVGLNLMRIVQKLGIEKNVIFSYSGGRGTGWSEQALCRLYNIFDCHISSSSGEGFNLPTLESMACGVPNIGTNICSFPELIGKDKKRGILVDCELQMLPDGIYRGLINEKKLSEAMIEMHSYWDKEDKKIKDECIKFSYNYTWSKIVDKWVEVFEKL
ncbi:MAG: glycosyltransferase [Candidatus Dojkabacteria bacterium]|nr:glycosyltransferase [Candidatus Dojkabacteria bacterium]